MNLNSSPSFTVTKLCRQVFHSLSLSFLTWNARVTGSTSEWLQGLNWKNKQSGKG